MAAWASLVIVLSGTVVLASRARMERRFWVASLKLVVTIGDGIMKLP